VLPPIRYGFWDFTGHYADGSFWNNWSSKGNVNPYTGKKGYKTPKGTRAYKSKY